MIIGFKFKQVVYFIGDVAFDMPPHWLKYLQEGDLVEAEAYFYNDGSVWVKGAFYAHCILVSLNHRYYVDREVPLGSLKFRSNLSLGFAVFVFILALVPMFLFAPVKSPGAIIQKYRYDLMPVREFRRVPDFFSNLNRIRTEEKIKINRAALAPAGQDTYYLYEPLPNDQENLADLVRNLYQGKETNRINLFKKFTGTTNYKLTYEETWRKFEVFTDNPEYDSMKRIFLTEGRAFLRNTDEENNIYKFEIMADEYRQKFLKKEQEKIDQIFQKRQQVLQRKLPDLYSRLLLERGTLLLKENKEYQYQSFMENLVQSIGSGDNTIVIRKRIKGLLKPIHTNGTEGYLIDSECENLNSFVLTGCLLVSSLGMGFGLVLMVRGVCNFKWNQKILKSIQK